MESWECTHKINEFLELHELKSLMNKSQTSQLWRQLQAYSRSESNVRRGSIKLTTFTYTRVAGCHDSIAMRDDVTRSRSGVDLCHPLSLLRLGMSGADLEGGGFLRLQPPKWLELQYKMQYY